MTAGINLKGIVAPNGTVHQFDHEYLANNPPIPQIDSNGIGTQGKVPDSKAALDEIKKVAGAVAAPYDPTSGTYAVGDYVSYDNKFYRCITAIDTPEAWTAAHWSEVPVAADLAAEIESVKEDLNVVYFSETFNQTGQGVRYIPYVLSVGDKFRITNKSSSACIFRQRDSQGTIVSNFTLSANTSYDCVSTVASNEVGFYFTQTGSATFEGLTEKMPVIAEKVDIAETELNALVSFASETFESGALSVSTGAEAINTIRLRTVGYISEKITNIVCKTGYKVSVFAYDDGSFVGVYNGSGYVKSLVQFASIDISSVIRLYDVRLVLSRNDSKDISTDEASNIVLFSANTPLRSYYVENYSVSDFMSGIINGGVTLGEVIDFTPTKINNGNWVCYVTKCYAGDKFTITAQGGINVRAYYFTDKNKKVIKMSGVGRLNAVDVYADADGYFVFNSTYEVDFGVLISRNFIALSALDDIKYNKESIKAIHDYFPFVPQMMPSEYPVISTVTYDAHETMSLTDVYAGFDALVSAHPSYVTKTTLGKDQSNTFDIYKYDFMPVLPLRSHAVTKADGIQYSSANFPTIIMDACIHGSEHACAKALLNFMDKLCKAESSVGMFGWLRRNFHFVIIPVVNPWGYVNNLRYNSNHVDLNRNFPVFWDNGSSDSESANYRGESAGSEAETQYIMGVLEEFENKALMYYNWHTFGSRTAYDHNACYEVFFTATNALQQAGYATLEDLTISGWNNHGLDTDSGYLGLVQMYTGEKVGMSGNYGASLNIPSASPEGLWRYNDGTSMETDYSTPLNCINAEFIMFAVVNAIRKLLYKS